MKKSKGITLISLVITIIVLLILAGVSISIIVGENGVLKQAQKSITKTEEANAKTVMEMAVVTLQTEYIDSLSENSNRDISEVFTLGKLNEELEKMDFQIADYDEESANDSVFGEDSTDETVFRTQIKKKDVEDSILYNVSLMKKNKNTVIMNNFMLISGEIGDSYDYSVTVNDEKIDKWKVFWKDEKGIYIITSDYLPVKALGDENEEDSILSKTKMVTGGEYRAYWERPLVTNDVVLPNQISSLSDSFLRKYHNEYSLTDEYDNSKVVSTLLNTANWSDFVDKSQGASYAIGGPTLEMWISSWNEKTKNDKNRAVISYKKNKYGYDMKLDSVQNNVTNNNDVGYDSRLEHSNMSKTDEYITAQTGTEVSVYFPYTFTKHPDGLLGGYWIASPSSSNYDCVCCGYSGGSIYENKYYMYYYGLRPVVYIQ